MCLGSMPGVLDRFDMSNVLFDFFSPQRPVYKPAHRVHAICKSDSRFFVIERHEKGLMILSGICFETLSMELKDSSSKIIPCFAWGLQRCIVEMSCEHTMTKVRFLIQRTNPTTFVGVFFFFLFFPPSCSATSCYFLTVLFPHKPCTKYKASSTYCSSRTGCECGWWVECHARLQVKFPDRRSKKEKTTKLASASRLFTNVSVGVRYSVAACTT